MAERTFTKADIVRALEYYAAMQAVDQQQNGKQAAPPRPKRERKRPEPQPQAVATSEA